MKASTSLYKNLTITNIHEEVAGVKTLVFEDAGNAIPYKAGQYLTFVLAGQEIRRSYSIASSPVLHEPLAITVKRIDNGVFSRYLIDQAKEGDQLVTTGAGGLFTLPAEMSHVKQIFFLAAGSGIVPIYSLLKTVLHAYPSVAVVLLYSNRSPGETIFRVPLEAMAKEFPNFRMVFFYSNSAQLLQARLYRESLLSLWRSHAVAAPGETLFYICGPQAYMRMCTYVLQGEGVAPEAIKRENFNTEYRPPLKAVPPDKDLHRVTIQRQTDEYQLLVQYPTTILQAAKKKGVPLPYSCEVGRCGSCVARCLTGKIWMSNNEVLTDKEIADGLVLTCTGYAINGDATLEIE